MKVKITRQTYVFGELLLPGTVYDGPGAAELIVANKAVKLEVLEPILEQEITGQGETGIEGESGPDERPTKYTSPSGRKLGIMRQTGRRKRV